MEIVPGAAAFPPQLTSSAARAAAASLLDEYAGLGEIPAIAAVDLLDGCAAGACRVLGLADEQARRVLGSLFAERRRDPVREAEVWPWR